MGATLLDLERIHVKGTSVEMGRQQGEALRHRIGAFLQIRFDAVETYTRERGRAEGAAGLLAVGAASMAIHERWDPIGVAEHRGIAEGAGVDPVELYTATNMTDLRDVLLLADGVDVEGCSAILIPAGSTAEGAAIAGQTWDLNPPDVAYVVAVHRTPEVGLPTWSVTCGGCLSLMGINAAGLAVGTTNIKTHGAKPGVGYLGLLHRALRTHTARQAADIIAAAPRSGAHTYWMADPDQQLECEASPHRVVLRDTAAGAFCRTNHCLDAQHLAIQGEPISDSSQARFDHITSRLATGGHSVDSVKAIFGDRSQGVLSVNRYAEDDQGTATNAVFIAVPAQRVAYACRGSVDRGRWYTLAF